MTVRDQADAPIKGAVARLLSLDRVLQLKSGTDGVLPFTNVVSGTYDLEVSAQGFRTEKLRDIQVPSNKPLEITLRIDTSEVCGRLDLVDYDNSKSRRTPVSGHIVEADRNKPISKAQVDLSKSGDTHVLTTTRSGKKGEFSFEELPPGRYDMHVRKDAYWPSEVKAFLVPRESSTMLTVFLDTTNHIHVCQ